MVWVGSKQHVVRHRCMESIRYVQGKTIRNYCLFVTFFLVLIQSILHHYYPPSIVPYYLVHHRSDAINSSDWFRRHSPIQSYEHNHKLELIRDVVVLYCSRVIYRFRLGLGSSRNRGKAQFLCCAVLPYCVASSSSSSSGSSSLSSFRVRRLVDDRLVIASVSKS